MKNNLKKIALATCISAACTAIAFAEEKVVTEKHNVTSEIEIKLTGYGHFQSGFRSQSNLAKDEKEVSNHRKNFAFFNEAAMFLEGAKQLEEMKYGAKIVLVPTAKRKGSVTYNGTHLFIESNYGRVELGSPISAGTNMALDGSVISAASGGDNWARYADFTLEKMRQSDKVKGKKIDGVTFDGSQHSPTFITYAEFFLDSKLVAKLDNRKYSSEPSRGISYYTPKFELSEQTKVQVGVTYIPDSSNTGADNPDVQSSGTNQIMLSLDKKEYFDIDTSVKDSFTGGIVVEQGITDGVDLKIALTGEYGQAASQAIRKSSNAALNDKKYKLNDLRTYNIGAVLNVGNFAYGASYGSLGKSLTNAEIQKTGRKTDYYTGAVAYKIGAFTTSVTYFKSEQYKNTVDAISLGADVKLAPGLLPYAEVSSFTLKGKPEYFPFLDKKKSRGTVGLIGLKLSL